MKVRPSRTQLFKSLDCKKMLVVGEKDPVMNAKNTLKLFENTQVKTLKLNGGHMSYIENLNELSYFIAHFIDF